MNVSMKVVTVRGQHIVNSSSSEKVQDIVNTFWALSAELSSVHAVSPQEAAWTTTMICAGDVKRSAYG